MTDLWSNAWFEQRVRRAQNEMHGKCQRCGVILVPHWLTYEDDPAIDCAGDCLECMQELEDWLDAS